MPEDHQPPRFLLRSSLTVPSVFDNVPINAVIISWPPHTVSSATLSRSARRPRVTPDRVRNDINSATWHAANAVRSLRRPYKYGRARWSQRVEAQSMRESNR